MSLRLSITRLLFAGSAILGSATAARADVVVTLESSPPITTSPSGGDYRFDYGAAPAAAPMSPAHSGSSLGDDTPPVPASSLSAGDANSGTSLMGYMVQTMMYPNSSTAVMRITNSSDSTDNSSNNLNSLDGSGTYLAGSPLTTLSGLDSGSASPSGGSQTGGDPLGAPEPGSLLMIAIASPFAFLWFRQRRMSS